MCRDEPIIVTVHGTPLFELKPIEDAGDDLINQLIEHNPDFRQFAKGSLNRLTMSFQEMAKGLGARH
jgi:hypothetical protein